MDKKKSLLQSLRNYVVQGKNIKGHYVNPFYTGHISADPYDLDFSVEDLEDINRECTYCAIGYLMRENGSSFSEIADLPDFSIIDIVEEDFGFTPLPASELLHSGFTPHELLVLQQLNDQSSWEEPDGEDGARKQLLEYIDAIINDNLKVKDWYEGKINSDENPFPLYDEEERV